MATYENDIIMRTQDEDGNDHINYPITHSGNVLIPDDIAQKLAIAAENDPTVSLALAALITALDNKAAKTDIPTSLPASGGTAALARGVHSETGKVSIWEDEEGGNISLTSADGTKRVEMDLYDNDKFRMYFTVENVHDTTAFVYDFANKKMLIRGELEGNADTVDGLHANAFMRWTTDTLDGDILTWASAQTVPTCISKISNTGTTPTDSPFSDGNTEAIYFVYMLSGGRKLVHCYAYHYSNNFTSSVHFTRVVSGNAWSSGWRNVADGGNADTVDGKHSTDFVATHPLANYDCNTLFDAGLYLISRGTNTPPSVDCGSLLVMPYRKPYGNEAPDFVAQIFIPTGDYSKASMWYRTSIKDTYSEWQEVLSYDNIGNNFVMYKGTIADVELLNNAAYTGAPYEGAVDDDVSTSIGLPHAWWHIKYMRHSNSDGYGMQIAFPLNSPSQPPRYRTSMGTTWDAWKNFNDGGNAETVDGLHGYQLGTLDTNGRSHGTSYPLMCKYNHFGDGRFGLYLDTHETRVNYATNADYAVSANHTYMATASNVCLRNMSSGTAAATTTNCPSGAWHGQHD